MHHQEHPHRSGWVITVAIGIALTACDVDDDVPFDGGPLGPDVCAAGEVGCRPYDENHALATAAQDLCRFLLDCCSDVDRAQVAGLMVGADALQLLQVQEPDLFADRDACLRAVHTGLLLRFQDELIGLVDDRRAFDEEAAAACFGNVSTAADRCAPALLLLPEVEPDACDDVFAPAVPLAGRCYDDRDCQDGEVRESTCNNPTGPADAGTLVALAGSCEPLPEVGEPCAYQAGRCVEGAACLPDVDDVTAEPITVCTALPPLPPGCDIATIGTACVPAGTCLPYQVDAVGNPTAAACLEPCVFSTVCGGDTFCVALDLPDPLPDGAYCLPRLIDGSLCNDDGQCASGKCDDVFFACVSIDLDQVAFDFCLGDQDNRTWNAVHGEFDAGVP